MNKFEGIDYFDLSELLTSEEIMMRDTIRQFVDEEVIPIIEKYYTEGTFPIHLVKKMGELGLMGMMVPLLIGPMMAIF